MRDVEAVVQRLMTAGSPTREDCMLSLEWIDKAVCEASAVGQAGRMAAPCVGLRDISVRTHVFAWRRYCASNALFPLG